MKAQKGVITVTLTLTLLVMLAVLTSALESARAAAGRFLVENAARLSTEAVLADFDALLFGNYHVFGKNTGESSGEAGRTVINNRLDTMIDKNTSNSGLFLWKYEPVEVQVTDCVRLTDYEGAFFRKQAVEYMEYRGTGMLVENLLETLGLFQKADEAIEILTYENEARQALSGIDSAVLRLIEDVDGIRCDEDGIRQNLFGKIKIADSFVKKMYSGTPTMTSVKVNHSELFDALEKKYEDPMEYLDKMSGDYSKYAETQAQIVEIEAEINAVSQEAEDGSVVEKAEAAVKKAALEARKLLLEAEQLITKTNFNSQKNKLKKLIKGCKEACEDALETMEEIELRRSEAKPKIISYGEKLAGMVGQLDSGLYQSLCEGLDEMKKYFGNDVDGLDRVPDFDGMRNTLEKDKVILDEITSILESSGEIENYESPEIPVSEYSFEKLWFDYSGIQLKSNGLNPLKSLKTLIESGVSGLVLPSCAEVSEKEIKGDDLPSNTIGITADDSAGLSANIDSSSILSLFKDSPLGAAKELLLEGTDAIAEKAAYLAYLTDHFGSYVKESDKALKYELEYILSGEPTDKENLNSFINRLVLVRTAFCLIHVLSDSDKCTKAKAFAAAALGFTGLPVLVEVAKFIVLFLWAFDEAMIETSAIMQGKKVAVMPDKTTFQVGFEEILFMTPAAIEAKAENRPEPVAPGLDYNTYLLLFLLLEKEETQNMRTMDMIQENLRLKDDNFRMAGLVYGFNAEMTFTLPALFYGMPYSSMKGTKGFVYKVKNGTKY